MKTLRRIRYAFYAGLVVVACWIALRGHGTTVSAAEPVAVQVEIHSVGPVRFRGEYELLLRAKEDAPEGKEYLPVITGPFEGRAIQMALNGISPRRPQTHDLLKEVVSRCGMRVEKVTVTKLEQGTFYAVLTLSRDGRELEIDARPSDSIALAARVGCPIYVVDRVLLQAGLKEPRQGEDLLPSLPDEMYF